MKASYRWLSELLPGLAQFPPAEVARRLTAAGLEIEGVNEFGAGTEGLRVARVEAIEPHPSKSGLRLVTVERGGGSQRVVCGAPNVPEPGGHVVLAPLGARLPAIDLTITPRAIGGVTSEGMLCSEAEMGIGAGDEGILVLRPEPGQPALVPGQPLPEARPSVRDTIFEVNVTPNRPDALGHLGLARDLAALLQLPLRPPVGELDRPTRTLDADLPAGEALPAIVVESPERCSEYGGAVLEGVTVGPSPLWVQHRLTSLGVRPINNLVDATNLVAFELGQPTHAFDLDRLRGATVVVRSARTGEKLTTLDGKERALDPDDLVIADAEGPTALAGVMGGASSEITPSTRRVFLECAYFEPRVVRRTARRHGLHSEASHRFERGIDRSGVQAAMRRLIALLLEISPGARLVAGPTHVVKQPFTAPEVTLRSARLDALLGTAVPFAEAQQILSRLGCERVEGDEHRARFRMPGWRPDLGREADLIEEVGRIRGYDRIEAALPPLLAQAQPLTSLDAELRAAAVGLGLSEAITYSFVSPAQLTALEAPPPVVRLTNPLTEERSVLRTSLLPGLLEALGRARRHGERSVRLFTIGHVFHAIGAGADPTLPTERRVLAAVLAGPRAAYLGRPEDHDAFDAKAIALELIGRALRREVSADASPAAERPPHLHPRAAGRVQVAGEVVGTFGLLHPDVIERLDLGAPAVVVELDLDALGALGRLTPQAAPIPRLPAVSRDVSFDVADEVTAGQVSALIREAAGELAEQVEVFDLFRGGSLPPGRRALAFRVTFRDPRARAGQDDARTLTDAEVDERHKHIVAVVGAQLGAVQR